MVYIGLEEGNTSHFNPDDEGSMFLQNVGIQQKYYMVEQLRRPPYFFTLP
jgi:hypothetical protein